jgi:hypothetical protein
MPAAARRRQPPITIRSARAAALLRRLTMGGKSQAAVIEEALEQLASQRQTLADALAPMTPLDFEWEAEPSGLAARTVDFGD